MQIPWKKIHSEDFLQSILADSRGGRRQMIIPGGYISEVHPTPHFKRFQIHFLLKNFEFTNIQAVKQILSSQMYTLFFTLHFSDNKKDIKYESTCHGYLWSFKAKINDKKKIIQIMEMLPDTKFKDLYAIIP